MHSISLITLVLATVLACSNAQTTGAKGPVTGTLGNASIVEDNPPGLIYMATLPTKGFFNPADPRGNIKGSVSATANPDGIGVSFQVNFENLPTSGGPFRMLIPYHDTFISLTCAQSIIFTRPQFHRMETAPQRWATLTLFCAAR